MVKNGQIWPKNGISVLKAQKKRQLPGLEHPKAQLYIVRGYQKNFRIAHIDLSMTVEKFSFRFKKSIFTAIICTVTVGRLMKNDNLIHLIPNYQFLLSDGHNAGQRSHEETIITN